jgi:CRISPR-associated protein Csm2
MNNIPTKENRSSEVIWRENITKKLEQNFPNKILNYDNLELEEFKKFNKQIQDYMKEKANNITSSKLRKIFEIIKKAQSVTDLVMTLPYLAYLVGREENRSKKDALGEIYILLKEPIMQATDDKTHVKNIQKFMETLVAYQKFYGRD